MTADERLAELGITLPDVPKPRWAYVPAVHSGDLLFISGQIAIVGGRPLHAGKLGREVGVAAGAEAARGCAISALAVAKRELGSLDRVARVVKTTVFIASAEGSATSRPSPTAPRNCSATFSASRDSARVRPWAWRRCRWAPASRRSLSSRCAAAERVLC